MSDIEFVDGLIFKLPHENAPEFVINIDLKVSREGKAYASVDTWSPEKGKQETPPPAQEGFDDDIPF